MSNSYEQWTQDPNTGQSHLWRWNEQTQNWDWVCSYPASEGDQVAGSVPYQADPRAAAQEVLQPVAEENWQYPAGQEAAAQEAYAPAQDVPGYEAPAQETSPEVTAAYEPVSDLEATTSFDPAEQPVPAEQSAPAEQSHPAFPAPQPEPTYPAAQPVASEPTPVAQPEPAVEPAATAQTYAAATAPTLTEQSPKGDGNGGLVKILVAVLALIALAVGGYFAYKYFFQKDNAESDNAAASALGNGVQLAWQYEVGDVDSNYNAVIKTREDSFILLTQQDAKPVYLVFTTDGASKPSEVGANPLPECDGGKYDLKDGKLDCADKRGIDLGASLKPATQSAAGSSEVLLESDSHSLLMLHQEPGKEEANASEYWMVATETAKRSDDVAAMLKDAAWAVELVNPTSAAPGKAGVLTSTQAGDSKLLVQYFTYAASPQPQATISAPTKLKAAATPSPTQSATPSATPTAATTEADGPLTNTHCTKHNKICFDYPANARIEESNVMLNTGKSAPASDDPKLTEMGTVIAADGTVLVQYMDNWQSDDACSGSVTVEKSWPISLSNNAGRAAAVSSGVTNENGKYTAQLYATNDPRLIGTSGYQSYDQCVYFLVQPSASGSKSFTWFQVADAVEASSEGEALAALQSERYQRALNILRTLRNE